MDKKLPEFVVNCANSGMSGYVGSINGVSHVGSEIFGAGLWFEVGLKAGVGLKFHESECSCANLDCFSSFYRLKQKLFLSRIDRRSQP